MGKSKERRNEGREVGKEGDREREERREARRKEKKVLLRKKEGKEKNKVLVSEAKKKVLK